MLRKEIIKGHNKYRLEEFEVQKLDLNDTVIAKITSDYYTGGMFDLFECERGFIIHGEIYILRVDLDLNVIWVFSGRDIWVRPHGSTPCCELTELFIILRDWQGYEYHVDYEGNLIGELYIGA